MRALACESRGCKANSYVLVSSGDLQPMQAEWEDIALLVRERDIECVGGRTQTVVRDIAFGKLSWWEVSFPAGVRLFANFPHGVRAAEKLMLAVVSFEMPYSFRGGYRSARNAAPPKVGVFWRAAFLRRFAARDKRRATD